MELPVCKRQKISESSFPPNSILLEKPALFINDTTTVKYLSQQLLSLPHLSLGFTHAARMSVKLFAHFCFLLFLKNHTIRHTFENGSVGLWQVALCTALLLLLCVRLLPDLWFREVRALCSFHTLTTGQEKTAAFDIIPV